MFIKFKPSTSNWAGWRGVWNAVRTCATAEAGSTPTKPTYVSDWIVVDNTVAGGWTANYDTTSTSSSSTGLVGSMYCDTPKTSIDGGRQMHFDLYRSSTSSYGGVYFRSGMRTSSQTSGTQYRNLTQSTGAGTNNYAYYWQRYNGSPHSCEWIVCAQAGHVWVAKEEGSIRKIVGMSKLSEGAEFDYTAGSLHFPVGGLYTGGTTTTSFTYESYAINAFGIQNQDESYGKRFNQLINWSYPINVNNNSSVTSNYVWPVAGSHTNTYNASPYNGTNAYLKSTFDSQGFDRNSVNDVVFLNPLAGWNPRSLSGIKLLGWNRELSTADLRSLHGQIMEAGGKKYMIWEQGKILWGLQLN